MEVAVCKSVLASHVARCLWGSFGRMRPRIAVMRVVSGRAIGPRFDRNEWRHGRLCNVRIAVSRFGRGVIGRFIARTRVVEVESFRNVDVFERDGWVCGICGGDVDRDLVWPDHMSASLDHIVPVSKGGTHTLDNVQCSHFICNSLKQAEVLEVI